MDTGDISGYKMIAALGAGSPAGSRVRAVGVVYTPEDSQIEPIISSQQAGALRRKLTDI